MRERLQKILSARGIASRRAAETMILEGRVSVGGVTAQLGDSADVDTDEILVDGKPLAPSDSKVYIMLNKPRGFVTTMSDERGRKTVAQLVEDCPARVYPVGRLDMDSEGLLLMTNDGELANRLMHPSGEVKKTYLVRSDRPFSDAEAEALSRPMDIDGYTIRPAEIARTSDGSVLRLTIHEGRNRQIRKMCQQVGHNVVRLRRIAEGGLRLGKLPAGKWRPLTDKELEELKKA